MKKEIEFIDDMIELASRKNEILYVIELGNFTKLSLLEQQKSIFSHLDKINLILAERKVVLGLL